MAVTRIQHGRIRLFRGVRVETATISAVSLPRTLLEYPMRAHWWQFWKPRCSTGVHPDGVRLTLINATTIEARRADDDVSREIDVPFIVREFI